MSIIEQAIEKYGEENQLTKAVEEMAELTQALCKGTDELNIAEEIADVEIMLEQVKLIYKNQLQVDAWKRMKLSRLEKRLKE